MREVNDKTLLRAARRKIVELRADNSLLATNVSRLQNTQHMLTGELAKVNGELLKWQERFDKLLAFKKL